MHEENYNLEYLLRLKEVELRRKLEEGLRPDEIYKCDRCNKPITFEDIKLREKKYTDIHWGFGYSYATTHRYSSILCPHCDIHKRKVDKWFRFIFVTICILLSIICFIYVMKDCHDFFDAISPTFFIMILGYGVYLITKEIYTIIDDWFARSH